MIKICGEGERREREREEREREKELPVDSSVVANARPFDSPDTIHVASFRAIPSGRANTGAAIKVLSAFAYVFCRSLDVVGDMVEQLICVNFNVLDEFLRSSVDTEVKTSSFGKIDMIVSH